MNEEEFLELLEKDMIKNPTLAIISSRLWWLALWAKISIFVEVSTYFESHDIIEYQIFCFIFAIVQPNSWQKTPK